MSSSSDSQVISPHLLVRFLGSLWQQNNANILVSKHIILREKNYSGVPTFLFYNFSGIQYMAFLCMSLFFRTNCMEGKGSY
jgi:hypothetical protein